MTAAPLLETKFHLPITHGRLVPRDRLSDQIGRAASATLTLVSAPAGFGKTTVMAELASRAGDARIAWLSLDPDDNDPVTFWTYVIEALDRAAPGVGGAARSSLAAGQGTVELAVTALLNGLAAAEADVVLVLDDVHAIDAPRIHQQLGYFLDHLPARAHLVMGTRADPAIPLARLRARGGLVEIRASDLRFSTDEAASYLGAMGLSLSDVNVAALEARTEGWIAALQLAALSLQGRADTTEFISAFAGDDRHIVDYLVEEVLRRQPAETREFLLKTSILSRFTGALADAVTAEQGGAATIEALDRANLFLVALDDQRHWYRYHHLFGDVLQAHLAAEMPGEIPMLHRRASDWFEQNGDRPAAVDHAFRAGDPERTAELVELAMPEMRQLRREATVRRWLDAIPEDVVTRRPVLAVAYAGTILSANEVDRVDELISGAERRIAAGEEILVVDEAELRGLPAMTELYRAALAKMRGDLEGNIAHARRVLDLVGDADHMGRGGAAAFLGLAYWGMGDLETGWRWYAEGMAELEKAGHITDLVGGAIVAADIRLAEGRLGDAMRIFEDGLALATRTQPPLRGTTDMYTGLAGIAYQRGHLADAQAHLDRGRHFGDGLAFPRDPYRSHLVQAWILQANGHIDAAVPLLDEAERLYLSEYSPDIRPVAAIRARMLIAHGRPAEARAWAQHTGLTPVDELTYVREYEHTTLARLLVAEAAEGDTAALAAALELLDGLIAAAEHGRRDGSRLDILVVGALARHAAGDAAGAFAALDAAIDIAEPEGYVRVFLDEGPQMTRLLKAAARRSKPPSYLHELVRAGEGSPDAGRTSARTGGLVEPLSERELEVLRLLRSDLGGPEIANELVVSLNTLRTHTKNIYAKLGVGSRRAAIRRAEELGLI
ncbi:MAG TPA: LuxR C-terminal-related transcriptional regulator [Candidatus Limnocylindrales bacterium]|nr:LuxR C-terminal-related transcriptional regulator [Candidatus Limnocylindrales bacterium]